MVLETISGLYQCQATFGNWGAVGSRADFLYFDRKTLDFGKRLQAKLDESAIFDGRITALEAHFPAGSPPQLSVLAEDRFQDLRMVRRTRSFSSVSDADIVRQIATDHGLTATVDLPGPTHPVVAQVNQSDLAFLRERARAMDAEIWMEGDALNAKTHSARNGGPIRMAYGALLREFSVVADLSGQRTSVNVSGWDVARKAAFRHEATESVISAELDGGESGPGVLASAFGPRKEALAHTVPLSGQETQARAESFFKISARRFLTGRGVTEADARLRVGTQVELEGLGPLFSGKYYVAEVRHTFDGTFGLSTEFLAERPGLGRA